MYEAYHLPGLDSARVAAWHTLTAGEVELRFPVLTSAGLSEVAARLQSARKRSLETRDVRDIARTLANAADRMLERLHDDELDVALAAASGYTREMVRHILERMRSDWRASTLTRLLDAELDGGRALDTFQQQPNRTVRSRAFAPGLTLHIFAGNVPGVAVTALIRSLQVRSAVLGKMASGEPILAALFARSLAEIDAGLGACVAITYWPSADEQRTHAAMERADAIVVYGGADAARAVRERAPVSTRVIEHGPRFSIGVVGRTAIVDDAAADAIARDVARAVATFDQQGCVSPHAIWVEEGGAIGGRALAERVARELEGLASRLPAGPRSAAEAVGVHDARARAEFRAAAGDAAVWAAPDTGWTVIWQGSAGFEPSPLSRTIRVLSAPALDEVPSRMAGHGAFLQTVAIAADRATVEALAQRFAAIGATRITDFERMPWPAPDGHHDGRGPLTELVRWVDLEQE